jgi:phosphate/sulfate permease
MGTEFLFLAVILLAGFAALDLMVGVSNDAVNFLNSSIGARAAPRHVILGVATLGILAGVTFSSGMMEVARKGIFHPEFFTMPELLALFLAVMITDVILLDLFNTYGLPTSTTVSIVFELLGAAVAVATVKVVQAGQGLSLLAQYINTEKALVIIGGILLSIVVAFILGALTQTLTRLVFTFDYASRMKRYGALWGGLAMASITYFILVKGSKGASFITAERAEWIASNAAVILLAIFAASVVILQILLFFRWNILKPIVLIGTFALAMAFAANDLVNFIGVPMAGYHAYEAAMESDAPLSITMDALDKKVPAETNLLLLAGAIMAVTLWISKKARTVTETELSLGQQEEGIERFESTVLSRAVVRMAIGLLETLKRCIPRPILEMAARRLDTSIYDSPADGEQRPSFDMLRASVNLMVASAVISYATSYKLPLSTTYITFMVAMGTSFADGAWGRESAVYRVTGVLTVVGGWFMTALTAFTISFFFAMVIFLGQVFGVVLLFGLGVWLIWHNHHLHQARAKSSQMEKIFNLKKVTSIPETISTTFEHTAYLLREIRVSLDAALEGLFRQNQYALSAEKSKAKKIQRWANIIVANVFKAMRLLQREDAQPAYGYGQTVRRLQKLADGHRDIVVRSYIHVSNQHKGFLDVQVEELSEVKRILHDILLSVESTLARKQTADIESLVAKDRGLRDLAEQLHQKQMERIRNGSSKTRLNILFYAILGNVVMLSRQNVRLLEIFAESFGDVDAGEPFDLD